MLKPYGRRYVKSPRRLFWEPESVAAQHIAGKSSRHAQKIFGASLSGQPALLVEYARGKDLEHRSPGFLRRNKIGIIRNLAAALAGHSQVLHRDLNTGNIIISTKYGKRGGRLVRPIGLKFIDYEKASIRSYPAFDVDMSQLVATNFDYSKIRNEIIPHICTRIGASNEDTKKLQNRFEREFMKSMAQKMPELREKKIETMGGYARYRLDNLGQHKLAEKERLELVGKSLGLLGRGFEEYSKKQAPENKIEAANAIRKTGAERLKEHIRRARWKNALVARNQ